MSKRISLGYPLMSIVVENIMFPGNYSNKIIELKRISIVWNAKPCVLEQTNPQFHPNSTVKPALSIQPLDDST